MLRYIATDTDIVFRCGCYIIFGIIGRYLDGGSVVQVLSESTLDSTGNAIVLMF
jgi:hypothetical protein